MNKDTLKERVDALKRKHLTTVVDTYGDALTVCLENEFEDVIETLIEQERQAERDNLKSVRDDDSCECDNCIRTLRYFQNPKKELLKVKNKAISQNTTQEEVTKTNNG